MFSYEEVHGGEDYVPYISLDPLNDPQSFTFRIKVFKNLQVLRNQILKLQSKYETRPVPNTVQCQLVSTPRC